MRPGGSTFDLSNSQLPRVLLQVNPGLRRQLDRQLGLMDHLEKKRQRVWEVQKRNFRASFQTRMEKRQRIYQRQRMKMDLEDTRKEVDAIKAERHEALHRRRSQEPLENRGQPHKTAAELEEDENAHHQARPWTPSSALESLSKGERDGDWKLSTLGQGGGQSSVLSSRRNSLKSSLLELDLTGLRSESPGSLTTDDPLLGVSGHATKPGVIVTRPPDKARIPSPRLPEDSTKLRASGDKIWSLMPAPTPTRFVGKMYAVVASPRRRRTLSSGFSRQSSLVSHSIAEDEDLSEACDEIPMDKAPIPHLPLEIESEEIIKKTEHGESASKGALVQSGRLVVSAKTLGKLGRRGDRSPLREHMGEIGGKISSAISKRNSWKSTVQASRDDVVSLKSTSTRPSLRRMTSILTPGAMGGGWKKISPASSTSSAAIISGLQAQHRSRGRAAPACGGSRQVGKTQVRFLRKSSQEVIRGFGQSELLQDPQDLKLPGMRRGFVSQPLDSVEPEIAALPITMVVQEESEPEDSDHLEAIPGEVEASMSSITQAFSGLMRKQVDGVKAQDLTRPESADGSLASISSMVKGIPTTSKLVSKLHSMRAQQDGEDGDPDDRWDWMTGVPTSIRFLAKSWKTIDRGPGGIITDTPSQLNRAKKAADFTGTVNMLTVLAKADLKLKSQSKDDHDQDTKGAIGGSRRGSRRQSSHIRRHQLSPMGDTARQESLVGSKRPMSQGSSLKTDSDPLPPQTSEADEALSALLAPLRCIDAQAIGRWNVDKSIQEEAGGQPFLVTIPT